MSFTPTSAQTLFMLRLVFGPREPRLADTRPQFKQVARRKELETLGLIRIEKRGRSGHVVLTERGWTWVEKHLDEPFNAAGSVPGQVLRDLLPRLKAFLETNRFTLGELCTGPSTVPESLPGENAVDGPDPLAPPEDPEAVLLRTLRALDRGRGQRLLIADARAALPHVSAQMFDAAALALQSRGVIALYHLDDPSQRSAAVEEAAIHVAGSRYHLAYLTA